MTTLRVPGRPDEQLKKVKSSRDLRVKQAVRLESPTQRSGPAKDCLIDGLTDNDVIELGFEGGIRRWVTVAEYKEEFGASAQRDSSNEIVVPSRLAAGNKQATRGWGSWLLETLRVYDFDPIKRVASEIVKHYDQKLIDKPGLFRVVSPQVLGREATASDFPKDKNKPLLVFIHGTASSTTNGYGKLREDIWGKLKEKYDDDAIFAWEHYTLSKSPIENALELAKELPDGAQLHLISHSRGGLVGELLCRADREKDPFDEYDHKLFEEHPKHIQTALKELDKTLKKKRFKIERFVRVACPAGGTTLAADRVDRWLEMFLNVLGKISWIVGNPLLDTLTDLLLDLKKQTANPEAIPGVAAMVPTSSVIQMLNRSDVELNADLSAIAGDVEGSGILGRIKVFFADLFYQEDHDLVVHSRAMYGGSPRSGNASYFFEQGAEVNHFNYFLNESSSTALWGALTRKELEAPEKADEEKKKAILPKGFKLLSELERTEATDKQGVSKKRGESTTPTGPRPVVFVLPGIMGTHLKVGDDRVWLSKPKLAFGGLAKLKIDQSGVKPEEPLEDTYGDLIEFLGESHEVVPFPFDWRLSLSKEAKRLAKEVNEKLNATDQPVRIIAHSMGGLLARVMFAQDESLWRKFSEQDDARFIMLGTPNGGSFSIPRVLSGRDKIVKLLALLDLKHNMSEVLEVVRDFDGLLQLLPDHTSDWDFYDADTWQRLANLDDESWGLPNQERLDEAKKVRDLINRSPIDPNCMAYVAGVAPETPIAIEERDDKSSGSQLRFLATTEGDGRVPWKTGILAGVPTWYMNVEHGDLANDKDSFQAIHELLSNGSTHRLDTTPPVVSRSAPELREQRADDIEVFPTDKTLELAAISGSTRRRPETPKDPPVKISVSHGNLSFCEHPVAVGHYEGDTICGAEGQLDHHLDKQLSVLHSLNCYPGPSGSVKVLLNPNKKPGGAIIIGLGKPGELSPRGLRDSFLCALKQYGVECSKDKATAHDIKFASLLVGAGVDGVSIAESLDAIVDATLQANRAFKQLGDDQVVRISEVHLFELYKTRAVQALKILHKQKATKSIEVAEQVNVSEGGRGQFDFAQPKDWWPHLSIRSDEEDSLTFTAPTGRARVETSDLSVRRGDLDPMINAAVHIPHWDQRLTAGMFEALIPNALKGMLPSLNNLLLMLDADSARYPWELLHDRKLGSDQPLTVEIGLIRQLETAKFRERVVQTLEDSALVIGDPPTTDFVPLPGAREEARLVDRLLRKANFQVRAEIRKDAMAINTSLLAADYRVLHLAGHGVFEYPIKSEKGDGKPKFLTGMVIDDELFLTAAKIKQMRQVPELVFINCCHLGVLSNAALKDGEHPRHKFAASIAEEFIKMGVRAVVAAGWAVDDEAALKFSETFYDQMLAGEAFGDAVREARKKTYELHGDRTNTWGAYQCYGDPMYKLIKRSSHGSSDDSRIFVDPDELIAEIDNVTSDARAASSLNLSETKERLDDLAKAIAGSWHRNAPLHEALGRAYGEINEFELALKHYELALKQEKATVSIQAAEQLANLRVRLAVNLDDKAEAQSLINQSVEEVKRLNEAFGGTSERWSLIGSAYKRMAKVTTGDSRIDALTKMSEGYGKAHKVKPSHYPFVNDLLAKHLVYLLKGGTRPKLLADLKSGIEMAHADDKEQSSFWTGIGIGNAKITHHLFNESLPEEAEGIANEYVDVWKRFGSPRELRSVLEHFDFLVKVLSDEESKKLVQKRKKLCEAVEKLRKAFEAGISQ